MIRFNFVSNASMDFRFVSNDRRVSYETNSDVPVTRLVTFHFRTRENLTAQNTLITCTYFFSNRRRIPGRQHLPYRRREMTKINLIVN